MNSPVYCRISHRYALRRPAVYPGDRQGTIPRREGLGDLGSRRFVDWYQREACQELVRLLIGHGNDSARFMNLPPYGLGFSIEGGGATVDGSSRRSSTSCLSFVGSSIRLSRCNALISFAFFALSSTTSASSRTK